jgi:hypothetical protein
MYEYDPLDAKALTEATLEGRAQLIDAFEFLTKYDPEFRDLELITSSSVLGVRESRRIRGEYYITKDDILNGARFDDAVAHVCFGADLHTKSNKGQRCFSVKPYHIPMGGDIDYAGGDRLGSTALSLNTITLEKNQITGTYDLQTVSPIMSLEEVWAKVP